LSKLGLSDGLGFQQEVIMALTSKSKSWGNLDWDPLSIALHNVLPWRRLSNGVSLVTIS